MKIPLILGNKKKKSQKIKKLAGQAKQPPPLAQGLDLPLPSYSVLMRGLKYTYQYKITFFRLITMSPDTLTQS